MLTAMQLARHRVTTALVNARSELAPLTTSICWDDTGAETIHTMLREIDLLLVRLLPNEHATRK